MRRRLLFGLLGAALAAGCAASRPTSAGSDCARTCRDMWDACTASCIKTIDPTGGISGSAESCQHTCSTQRYVCDVKCLKARRASSQ